MKRVLRNTTLALAGLLFGFVVSCRQEPGDRDQGDVAYYTCTMHPSVKSHDPKGKCPICNMNLVAVMKSPPPTAAAGHYICPMHPSVKSNDPKSKCPICQMDLVAVAPSSGTNAASATSEFVVPLERQQLIGVRYATAEKKAVRQFIRSVGFVAYQAHRHWDLVSRVEGYVQELKVASPGELVKEHQPLFTIYSPELLTSQQELLNALRVQAGTGQPRQNGQTENASKLVESARRRLLLSHLDAEQLRELETTGAARDTVTIFSPFKGVVQNLQVSQGARVMPGAHLVDIADLSEVWVWAEWYQEDFSQIRTGLPVVVTTAAHPGEQFQGTIGVIDPFLNPAKRTGRVRIDLANPELKLRPNMYVDVEAQSDQREGLVIPASAVLPTGKRNLVFVDKGDGKLEPRFIQIDRQFGEEYLVKSGLEEGERIVVSGNFLIDAEAKVQGAIQAF